ncbi:MAG: hypothetical protein ACRCXX_14200 [Cetobacterium sp.]|uniref:hypothetical protein n=1 Tax=Cetobacterium sp. TaxID=2071632 RepID=UPI003F327AF1
MLGKNEKESILASIRSSVLEERKEEIVEKETISSVPEEKISISKKRRSRNRNKKKKSPIIKINELAGIDPKILSFKEKYMEDEKNREFLRFMNAAKIQGDEVFDEMEFFSVRMNHSASRVLILEPSIDDLALKKGQKWFLIKSINTDEYMQFVREFGPRETKPKEFMEFAIKKCVLLPKMDEKELLAIPAGTLLTIYRTVLDISDFNKMYKIVEV